jgi:thioredoxin 2
MDKIKVVCPSCLSVNALPKKESYSKANCKMMAPVFSQVASTLPLKVMFAKVNTEEEQNLSAQFGIRSIPTLILFKNAKEVKRVSGALDAASLKQFALS